MFISGALRVPGDNCIDIYTCGAVAERIQEQEGQDGFNLPVAVCPDESVAMIDTGSDDAEAVIYAATLIQDS